MGNCWASKKKNDKDDGHGHKQYIIQAEIIIPAIVEISQVASVLEVGLQAGDECEKMKMLRVQEERNNDGDDVVDKNDNNGCDGGGAMRLRVMVTKKELKQILSMRKDLKFSSVEDFVKVLRLRDRRRRECHWKPALESIPEDQSHKMVD